MILICIFTDLFPALSMVYEKPEADLLLRKPRNRKTERLVDFKLLLQAYGFIGVIETLTSMVGYVCILILLLVVVSKGSKSTEPSTSAITGWEYLSLHCGSSTATTMLTSIFSTRRPTELSQYVRITIFLCLTI
jgi:magnesium-transporting ATPase (P-type)